MNKIKTCDIYIYSNLEIWFHWKMLNIGTDENTICAGSNKLQSYDESDNQ